MNTNYIEENYPLFSDYTKKEIENTDKEDFNKEFYDDVYNMILKMKI